MRRLLAALWICLLLTPSALGESIRGQAYATFEAYYEEDIEFINDNLNRHMLPLVIASASTEERDGRILHQIFGDVLSLTIRTDPSGEIIEMCQIMITAPVGMEAGNSVYNDFAISGYHSYALLMAMDASPNAYERYAMVTMVEDGLKEGNGSFSAQIGVYALTCTSINGTVTMTFDNTLVVAPEETEAPDEEEPDAAPEEEAAPEDIQEEEESRLG